MDINAVDTFVRAGTHTDTPAPVAFGVAFGGVAFGCLALAMLLLCVDLYVDS